MASVVEKVRLRRRLRRCSCSRYDESDSTFVMIFCWVVTASMGYLPAADSAESITASAPSNTAVATSDTSARVGLGDSIMLSSIWVATMTGLPCARATSMISFWSMGTSSGSISTPKSPRATMMPSHTSVISLRLSMALGFSILAITLPGWSPMSSRSCRMSAASCTKLSATQSKSISSRQSWRSLRSLGVRALPGTYVSGRLNPLREESVASFITSALTHFPSASFSRTMTIIFPSSINTRCPTSSAAITSG
mmetsp:Transcript_71192/g.161121  ORF Transcript_71192/g.161121 Transcript_71192/m.161121 type:complete len:253 (-) Transcript_71192:567-1325(-)